MQNSLLAYPENIWYFLALHGVQDLVSGNTQLIIIYLLFAVTWLIFISAYPNFLIWLWISIVQFTTWLVYEIIRYRIAPLNLFFIDIVPSSTLRTSTFYYIQLVEN